MERHLYPTRFSETEIEGIIDHAIFLPRHNTLPHGTRAELAQQISHSIFSYTSHPHTKGEMIPKSPEELLQAHEDGHSQILYSYHQGEPIAIAHVALWPLFSLTGENIQIDIREFGSFIVEKEFRHHRINGLTIGEFVAANAIALFQAHHDGFRSLGAILATVKRENSMRALEKVGLKPTRFHDVPIISALTCTCAETSEHYNDSACAYRRRPEFGETFIPEQNIFKIDDSFKIPNGEEAHKIPCTLMRDGNLQKVERILQDDYVIRIGHLYPQRNLVGPESMRDSQIYFNQLQVQI